MEPAKLYSYLYSDGVQIEEDSKHKQSLRLEKRWARQNTKLFMLLNCIIFQFQSVLVALGVRRGNDSFNAILMFILMIIIVRYQVSCDE